MIMDVTTPVTSTVVRAAAVGFSGCNDIITILLVMVVAGIVLIVSAAVVRINITMNIMMHRSDTMNRSFDNDNHAVRGKCQCIGHSCV